MTKPIRLYWFRKRGTPVVNFGDDLSPVLVAHLAGRPVVHAPPHLADLAAVGSILQHIRLQRDKPKHKLRRLLAGRLEPTRVWGSGTLAPTGLPTPDQVAVFALRGPLTRAAMHQPETLPLGDPGLLVDRLDVRRAKRHRWGIVAHVDDTASPAIATLADSLGNPCRIDLRAADVLETVRAIQSCDFIVSSSLHGLITADALGIPNVWLAAADRLRGGDWKFHDYLAAVGRPVPEPLRPAATDPRAVARTALEGRATVADAALVEVRRTGLLAAFAKMGL